MRLAVDAMGGDFAPEPIVRGAVEALRDDPELHIVLVGDQARLDPLLAGTDDIAARYRIEHTTEFVDMHDSPGKVLRAKPRASILLCWGLLATNEVDGLVSAGNTGAVVAGGLASRRFLKGVQRPGIAVMMPSPDGWSVMLDVGANVAPKPEHLFQYGVMGRIFAKQILKKHDPTVGLLNIGSEDSKGNSLAKATQQLFQASTIRDSFRGNIEGRDVNRGQVDVIVCEGFVGNIVLKCCEGMVDFLMAEVKRELTKLGAEKEMASTLMHDLHNRYHYSEFGGAPLLGIDGVCLICHGASDHRAIRNACHAAKRFNPVNRQIVKEMAEAMAGMAGILEAN
jgi:glycerol-3-phosphate acyltransferase PlsX